MKTFLQNRLTFDEVRDEQEFSVLFFLTQCISLTAMLNETDQNAT